MERQAQKLIKQHLSKDAPSYKELTSSKNQLTGFMNYYLKQSRTDETMSSSADYFVMMRLAQTDQLRDSKTAHKIVLQNSFHYNLV